VLFFSLSAGDIAFPSFWAPPLTKVSAHSCANMRRLSVRRSRKLAKLFSSNAFHDCAPPSRFFFNATPAGPDPTLLAKGLPDTRFTSLNLDSCRWISKVKSSALIDFPANRDGVFFRFLFSAHVAKCLAVYIGRTCRSFPLLFIARGPLVGSYQRCARFSSAAILQSVLLFLFTDVNCLTCFPNS